jgi:post-segregation antitoxin (ccd killing protein)
MVRKKSSVYVDEELWRRLKKRAMDEGVELSALLEEVIHEELMDYVNEALEELAKFISAQT